MRASTLFLLTWLIWITAKGKLGDYWALATSSGTAAPGEGLSRASPSPGSILNPLPSLPNLRNNNNIPSGSPLDPNLGNEEGGGW